MRYVVPVGLIIFALSGPIQTLSPEEVAVKVETKLRSIDSLQASFEQTRFSASATTPLQEKGKFYFRKPESMRWDYLSPEKFTYLYTGGLLQAFFPEDNQLYRTKSYKDKFETEILSILTGEAVMTESYQVEFTRFPSESAGVWQLRLVPKNEGEFSYILLEIDPKSLLIQRAISLDWAGNKQGFRFSQIKPGARLKPDLFELKVPPDCEIIEGEPERENKTNSGPHRIYS